ncbi:MAG TPA: Crp/Fnr family transcriptional regulator, partial [Saprospiraceae bacterium]|nr:Crp/Fnr family transcriptional regulator [Saprospiraceae bacterium]
LDKAHAQAAERLQNFQTMNATERYLNLLERNPRIVQSIALTFVASYLGINKASLSKIRSALK